jgi:hypothetical protein
VTIPSGDSTDEIIKFRLYLRLSELVSDFEKIRVWLECGASARLETILKRMEAALEFPLLLRSFAGLEECCAIR